MGYGVPAGVGAKRVQPDSPVVVFAGDGDFLMNGQEFATAVQYDLPILVILLDNGMYGTIRMHQERDYPGRVSATLLKNPDFAAYAKAFGGHGERVERTEEFAPALRARARIRQTRYPALHARSGSHHAVDVADADPREGAGGEVASGRNRHRRHARAWPGYPRLCTRRRETWVAGSSPAKTTEG